jgi:tetratricopeptide (TPR) repeat protein
VIRLVAALLAAVAALATAADTVETARALLVAWHLDPARIDQARTLLEGAAAPNADPETLVELSRVWFLTGDFRARSDAERLAAYEAGSQAARQAIALAPRNERAHLWLAINSGRWAEVKGVMRALSMLATIREESETVLRLNPSSVEGLILAGGLAAEVPTFLGGDRAKAERLFRRALEIDPHHTGGRLELARLYLATRQWRDARRELQLVIEDPEPTDRPRWTVSEVPRARSLLARLPADTERGAAPQSP